MTPPEVVAKVEALFWAFGIDLRARMAPCADFKTAALAFATARVDAKREFKRLALTMHPDRGGDLAAFQELSGKMQLLEELKFVPPAPPPPQFQGVRIVVHLNMGGGGTSATGSGAVPWW